jgi:hypothetical protein
MTLHRLQSHVTSVLALGRWLSDTLQLPFLTNQNSLMMETFCDTHNAPRWYFYFVSSMFEVGMFGLLCHNVAWHRRQSRCDEHSHWTTITERLSFSGNLNSNKISVSQVVPFGSLCLLPSTLLTPNLKHVQPQRVCAQTERSS